MEIWIYRKKGQRIVNIGINIKDNFFSFLVAVKECLKQKYLQYIRVQSIHNSRMYNNSTKEGEGKRKYML